jgi:hypothetical protein
VKLDNRFAFGPSEMMDPFRNHSECPGGERDSALSRELVAHADVQRTAYYGDMLIGVMEVRRNPISWRHHEPHGECSRFHRIAVEHSEFRSRW